MEESYKIKELTPIYVSIEFYLSSGRTLSFTIRNPKNYRKGFFIKAINEIDIELFNFLFVFYSPDNKYHIMDFFNQNALESFFIEYDLKPKDLNEVSNSLIKVVSQIDR